MGRRELRWRAVIEKRRTVRLGLVGAGRWGKNYISTIATLPHVTLCRLASRSDQAQNLVGPQCTVSTDWRDIIDADDLDGLVLAVPPQVQVEIALHAIKAKLPVLLEKPMAIYIDDAVRLRDAAAKRNVPLMVDHIYLFHPAFQALKQEVSRHGPIRKIRSVGGNAGPYRSILPPLWDWAPHDVAMCLDLLDEFPHTIQAHRLRAQGKGEVYSITLDFASGPQATITTGNGMAQKTREMVVECDEGSWLFDDLAPNKLTRIHPDEPITVHTSNEAPLSAVLQAFVNILDGHPPARSGANFSAEVVAVISEAAKQMN